MRILLLGSDYFRPWLKKAGAEVVLAGPDKDCDLIANLDRVDINRLVNRLDAPPDFVLLTDDLGRRVMPWGIGRLDSPAAYYAVDGPINRFWQRHLVDFFDLAAVDQKDSAAALSAELDREVMWLPVAVDPEAYQGPAEEQVHDIGFVGALDESVRPKRSNIIELLKARFDVVTAGERGPGWVQPAEAARLYRRSKLVLNENLFPGVTTRMLEAMAAGGCLFTEDAGNGLADLFTDGVHLVTFGPENMIERAQYYLDRPQDRARIAQAGRAEVRAKHSIEHRVRRLLAAMDDCLGRPRPTKPGPLALGWAFLLVGLRWPTRAGDRRVMEARLQFGRAVRENPDSAEAVYGLGLSLAAAGRWAEAIDQFAAAGSLTADDFRPHLAEGLARFLTGRQREGGAVLVRAAHLAAAGQANFDPAAAGESRPGQADFHLVWGRILTAAGDGLTPGFDRSKLPMIFWGGLEHLTEAIKLDPANLSALIEAARLLDSFDQSALSVHFWRRAAALDPDDARLAEALHRAELLGYAPAKSG